MNFDRLYFADAITLALLGIYGIARTFADTIKLLFQRMGSLLIFPKVSASQQRGFDLQRAIRPIRLVTLLIAATGLALAVRSEARRVGKERYSTFKPWWS